MCGVARGGDGERESDHQQFGEQADLGDGLAGCGVEREVEDAGGVSMLLRRW